MTDGSGRKGSLRILSLIAVALVAGGFLLSAEPRDANGSNWVKALVTGKRLADAEKDRRGLKRYFGELIDQADEGLGGVFADDGSKVEAASRGQREALGRLLINKIDPTDGGATAAWNKGKSAVQKIKRFFGGASAAVSGARSKAGDNLRSAAQRAGQLIVPDAGARAVDPRAALSVTRQERSVYESGTGIFSNKPLPAPVRTTAKSAGSASWDRDVSSSSSSPWFEKDFVRRHYDYRHCWGVFDDGDDHDPYECMAETDAKRNVAAKVQKAQPNKPSKKRFDWSSEWTVEGDGSSVWDRSNSRYDDKDREAARVSHYASRCWGEHYVTRDNVFLHDLMKSRMERNECPEEERQDKADEAKSDYESALNDALDDDEPSPSAGDDDYGDALNNLETREEELKREAEQAEQRRIEEEERERHRQLAAQQRVEREERERVDRREKANEREQGTTMSARRTSPNNGRRGYNCKQEDARVIRAMTEAQDRGLRDHSQAYCAAINIGRAVIWKVNKCLVSDPNLTDAERSQLEAQLSATRQSIRQNTTGNRQVNGAYESCRCWSKICND